MWEGEGRTRVARSFIFGMKPSHAFITAASTEAHRANSVTLFPPRPARRNRQARREHKRAQCNLLYCIGWAYRVGVVWCGVEWPTELLSQERVDDSGAEEGRLGVEHEHRQAERVLLQLSCSTTRAVQTRWSAWRGDEDEDQNVNDGESRPAAWNDTAVAAERAPHAQLKWYE